MTLSRRARAALALALEQCRAGLDDMSPLRYGGAAAADILRAASYPDARDDVFDYLRLRRVRLALLLRAVLRAAAGDFGPRNYSWCQLCASHDCRPVRAFAEALAPYVESGIAVDASDAVVQESRRHLRATRLSSRITPLWSLAPATRAR